MHIKKQQICWWDKVTMQSEWDTPYKEVLPLMEWHKLALTPGMDADTGPSAQLVVVILLTASRDQSVHDLQHTTTLNNVPHFLYTVQQYSVSQPGCHGNFNSNICYTHSTIVHKGQYNQQDLAAPFCLVDNERELSVRLNCVLVHCEEGGRSNKEFTLAELNQNAAVPKTIEELKATERNETIYQKKKCPCVW